MPATDETRRWLDLAARVASRAAGHVEPNPMVGAVIVRDGVVIGIGHHRRFGGPHAERDALANAVARGHDPRGAILYVTLEPCRHTGKQPPCTDAVIAAGISRVVYARPDPGRESGGGAAVLRAAGVDARLDTTSAAAVALSDPFVHRARTGLPWVIAKWAQTIDGRIATRTGVSKWISNEASRRRVHRLRGRVDAILTGLGTVLADDPLLTARGPRPPRRVAARVVVDPDMEIPPACRLVTTAAQAPTILACSKELLTAGITERRRHDLEQSGVRTVGVPESPSQPGRLRLDMLLAALARELQVTNVLVESGAGLLSALFEQDLVNEAVVYIAPTLMGDAEALAVATGRVTTTLDDARRFRLHRVKRLGDDVELTYRRHDSRA